MDLVLALGGLAVVQLMAVISPGQSFLLVARTAMIEGRPAALVTTLGLALGSCVWAVAALLGMAVVLEHAAWVYALLKIAGGLYLIYLGITVWRHAAEPIDLGDGTRKRETLRGGLLRGVLVQITNPKVVVFFGSIFFALLPASAPVWAMTAAVVIVFVNEAIWFALVSLLFSAQQPRRAYLRLRPVFDRVMAGVLGLIGAKLIADAR